eukprot:TRINITY_DN8090_c0_g1_i2.p1 TRINITY_DN8090_c0_g1~~TRINITY_DN8090_c0_g1_i2.p1  ORF type:complete len:616 (+),score=184.35 TRINITY_DN8090_c0_g1_i2:67-1848(+)
MCIRDRLYLEDVSRYKEAEEHFIKAGKPNEAINMYEHQGDWNSALQVARQHEPNSVAVILMNQGRFFLGKKDLARAEAAFVGAKKPEIAVKMYTDAGNYQEAIRVAKKHAPHLVGEINTKFVNKGDGNLTGEEIIASAKLWEESRDWRKAIDTYLEITREHFTNPDILEEVWEKAVHIAMSHDKERAHEVISIVCKRLHEIKRFEPAAEFYETIGMYEEAVVCYLHGKLFDKARGCVSHLRNPELSSRLTAMINNAYKQHLVATNQAEDLVVHGDVGRGLDMLADRGDWQQCFDLAKQQGGDILNKYLLRYAKQTMEAGRFGETVAAFAKFGPPITNSFHGLYKKLSMEIFVEADPSEIANLKVVLFRVTNQIKDDANTLAVRELTRFANCAHLAHLRKLINDKKNLGELYAKLCISLLRYCDLMSIDRLFYDAGMACRRINWLPMAFVLLNRYLDIYEVIEDPDNNNMGDNSDFQTADIPSPFDVPLPEKNFVKEKEKEELRDWLLQTSINQKTEMTLNHRPCEKCGTKIYEAALTCFKCKTSWEPCIVSGYPLGKGPIANCRSCGRGALKDAWSVYLQHFANCPWCNNPPQ